MLDFYVSYINDNSKDNVIRSAYALVISDDVIVVVVDIFLICDVSFLVLPIKLLVFDNPLPLET